MSIWRGGAPSHLFPHSNPNVSRTAPYSRFSCYADRQRLASVGGEGIWARAMRLLDTETGHFVEKDPQNTKYAILSHTWDREEQTCKQLNALTLQRVVWLGAYHHLVLTQALPTLPGKIEDLDAKDLEQRTSVAVGLRAAWEADSPAPRRTLQLTGGPLNSLLGARFVLKRRREWLVTISQGIWTVR